MGKEVQPMNEVIMNIPKKKSVILLFVLSVITLGIYCSLWYLKRVPELNNLQTPSKLKKGAIASAFIIHILLVGSIIGLFVIASLEGISNFNQNEVPITFTILFFTAMILLLIESLLFLLIAFKTRKILNESLINKGILKKVSGFYTFFLNYYYLQYEINRIILDKEEKKRVGPLIIFLLIYLIIPIGLVSYYYFV